MIKNEVNMIFKEEIFRQFYATFSIKIEKIQSQLRHPLTLTEKILYVHLAPNETIKNFRRGIDYVNFVPDRVAMQDATAQMALLQLMNSGREKVAVPTSVHCDHLIEANNSAWEDLKKAKEINQEIYDFLKAVSNNYGIYFWEPGAGIIHQIIFENYAFPGGMMIGTDSHTPTAGGLSMIAIGVGGADAVDVMAGLTWELRMPKIIGVKLTGKLSGWASPKDVILKLAGMLTVKGATNAVLEYFGEGTETLSATGKATICNMGAEVGATTSIFPYDKKSEQYLKATGRNSIATMANKLSNYLTADPEVLAHPEDFYDKVIEINLNEIEPHINGPFTPDAAYPISKFAKIVKEKKYPQKMEVGLIGSCTNSSYEDLSRAASVFEQAIEKDLKINAELLINPGSEQIKATAERDGILEVFTKVGGVIMANACGPCIGQWSRKLIPADRPNSIVTTFNRNFAKRNDGNPNTHAFLASPEIVAALTIAGDLCFNPLTDFLTNEKGEKVKLSEPIGFEFPSAGYETKGKGYIAPTGKKLPINIDPHSERLQLLQPFPAWDGKDMIELALLIKVKGKCTTDHISMAGPWLRYRGHLDKISDNLLMGAVNAFNNKTNSVLYPPTGEYIPVSAAARKYKAENIGSVVVAEENYGEGSSREHAAMEPRYLNVKAIIAKSFARIHETNLKKQGMLALTFINKSDYDRIREDDKISILGLTEFSPGKNLKIQLHHSDGTTEQFEVVHSYNQTQIEWFKAGSALNFIKKQFEKGNN